MPAKMQERGTTIDSCSLEIWEQKLKILLYAWEKVYTYGDAESMCTDGIVLNRYRQEILHAKSHLENLGSKLSYTVPKKMPEKYMAQAETIRTQAQKSAEDYFSSDDYRVRIVAGGPESLYLRGFWAPTLNHCIFIAFFNLPACDSLQ